MSALWPVFGLLVLTIEWVVLRRVSPRLHGRSVAFRALIGALAGLGMSVATVLVGLGIVAVAGILQLEGDAREVAATAFLAMYLTGILFSPVAAIFGAVLLAVERYRVETPADDSA
jgi:hypothetical protein